MNILERSTGISLGTAGGSLEKTLNIFQRVCKPKPFVVKASFSRSDGPLHWNRGENNSPHDAGFGGFGDGDGDVRWVEPGSMSFGRPSTALEAGRGKVEKGQPSGGRIERRPVSNRRLNKPSNPGDVQYGAANEQQDGGEDRQQGRDDLSRGPARRTDEEELNSTWEEAGLTDRRSKGRFLPQTGQPRKEATRVGGWGRDKSMQRVITPDEQRAARGGGSRERTRSGVRQKPQSGTPAVKKKKKKWDLDFDPDPRIRHPPEYYKNGPYGIYAWRGLEVGEIVEGDMATNQVVYFSNVKDDAEAEDREMANVAVDYTNTLATFDTRVGIQYFYAFARRRIGPRPDPWEDWTLVAQIAIEAGNEIGEQWDVFYKMGSHAQDITTQCIAWARPDLTYVKKSLFHLRLERQEEFLLELFNLLDPAKDGDDDNSYYATLCRLLKVELESSSNRVRYAYEAVDEKGKMDCLKHVFTKHPVEILSRTRYEKQLRGQHGELQAEYEDETDDESNDTTDEEDKDQEAEGILHTNRERRGIDELDSGRPADLSSKPKGSQHKGAKRAGNMRKKREYLQPAFRSAVRPYSYSDVIEEMAEIRTYLSRKQSMMLRIK